MYIYICIYICIYIYISSCDVPNLHALLQVATVRYPHPCFLHARFFISLRLLTYLRAADLQPTYLELTAQSHLTSRGPQKR